jgi:hypothetical protein
VSKRARKSFSRAIAQAIEGLASEELLEISEVLRRQAREKGFLLQGENRTETTLIPIALTPWVITPEAARYLQSLFRGIRRTVNRIVAHYFEDPKLQAILPLRESELEWLQARCVNGFPRPQTIFERFDTNLGPNVEEELATFQIIEFNAVGVGCIYLAPAATELLKEHLLPRLSSALADLPLSPPADYRQLLLGELKGHAKGMELDSCRCALVERRETVAGGVDEFAKIAQYLEENGVPATIGDPRDMEHKEGGFFLKEKPIDIAYRDFQLEEVVSIKTHGGSVEGMEAAFSKNRVVSTIFGEFDHKSMCELLTNPDFAHYLNPQEVRAARHRIPWTRLIEERRTADWEGKEVDLIPAIRENRQRLILKPNRGYGGEGVAVGQALSASEWEVALNQAAEKPKAWVVQERVPIARAPVMVLRESGKPQMQEQYVTLGITATSRGVAFVGRSSEQPVVNITQGGGLVPVFLTRKKG